MFSKYNPGDWSLTPELQRRFEEVQAHTRRLQAELGITPMTLEERAAAYAKRKQEEVQAKAIVGKLRPPPKWKI